MSCQNFIEERTTKYKNQKDREIKMILKCLVMERIDNDEEGVVEIPIEYFSSLFPPHEMFPIIDDIIKDITTHPEGTNYDNGYYYVYTPNGSLQGAYILKHNQGEITILDRDMIEKKDDYDMNDDWDSCAGFKYDEEEQEYILYMCGGCSEWWNYIITKNGVYREDRWGREKMDGVLYTDEESYYVSLKDEDYELKNGESNICDMVNECYF